VNVAIEIENQGNREKVPPHQIASLAGETATDAFFDSYFARLREFVLLRKIETISTQAQALVQDVTMSSEDIMSHIKIEMERLEQSNVSNIATSGEIYQDIVTSYIDSGDDIRLKTGYSRIDSFLELHMKETTLMAGESSIGKTSLVTNICTNINATGIPVLFFSLEMSAQMLGMRCLSALQKIPLREIRDKTVDAFTLMNASEKHMSDTFFIEDSVYDLDRIESISRRYASKYGVRLMVLDYIQLVDSPFKGSSRHNREQEISEIGKRLKKIAKNANLHALGISSLA
jgi:replicative DNA helicase